MSSKINSFFYVPKGDEATKARVERYTKYEQVFVGDHMAAFNPTIPKGAMYINEMFGSLISKTSADLLFGEPPTITADSDSDKDFIDSVYEWNSTIETRMSEAALSCSYFGDILIELSSNEDGELKIEFVDPRYWMVKKNLNNDVTEHILSFSFLYEKKRYVRQKIHRKGTIEHKLFEVKNDTKVLKKKDDIVEELQPVTFASVDPEMAYLDANPIEETGVDEFLIFHIPNFKILSSEYGMSDYAGLDSLMNALNMLTSFATMILEKHADPAIEVPVGTLDEDGEVYIAEQKTFQTNAETKGIPRYVTWDGQLTALFEQRTHVMQMLALYSEISLGLLGFSENGQIPESGRALRLKYARTLMKIARKQRYWDEGLRFIFSVGSQLLGKEKVDVNIEWDDGLPVDYTEELEQAQLEKTVGVKSNETVVREVLSKLGWDNDMIDKEVEKLLSEKPSTEPKVAELFKQPEPLVQEDNGKATV